MEKWKDINGFEGLYQVSNLGRIKSLERLKKNNPTSFQLIPEQYKTIQKHTNGYCYVLLYKNAKHHSLRIHRLVAEAFIPNSENKSDVNHIDGDKQNNSVNNLEWSSRKENMKHAKQNGLLANQYGKY